MIILKKNVYTGLNTFNWIKEEISITWGFWLSFLLLYISFKVLFSLVSALSISILLLCPIVLNIVREHIHQLVVV